MTELDLVFEDPDKALLFHDVEEALLARNRRDVDGMKKGADEDRARICGPGARRGLDEHNNRQHRDCTDKTLPYPLAHASGVPLPHRPSPCGCRLGRPAVGVKHLFGFRTNETAEPRSAQQDRPPLPLPPAPPALSAPSAPRQSYVSSSS